MNRINLILFILLINVGLILMLNKRKEYLIETCCSLNEKDQIFISCSSNEFIYLKLIEIFYNSNEYCSSEYSCCKYKTKCSRRLTKYSTLHCDGQNSCQIDKTCFKIYDHCSNINGLYGQYITIQYSCLTNINQTDSEEEEEPVPFVVKLLASDQLKMNENSLIENELKSSPMFLIIVILAFLLFLLITYFSADQFGKKICRKRSSKTNRISTEIYLENLNENKIKVQSNPSFTMNRVYPNYNHPYSYQTYLTVHQHPSNRQFYSTSFNPYLNY